MAASVGTMTTAIPIDILNDYEARGLLKSKRHPTLPLLIWNYTSIVQFKKRWDNITSICRGLITDNTGIIVGRSFPKFHNHNDSVIKDILDTLTNTDNINTNNTNTNNTVTTNTINFTVQEKLDGSLGILFYYNHQWLFTSRGDFTSEQALHAINHINNNNGKYITNKLNTELSYIFEIIYPSNHICVNYGHRDELVFLAAFYKNGIEALDQISIVEQCGFPIVKEYNNIKNYNELMNLDWPNKEGFVIRFNDNENNGFRIKIKFNTYVLLHRTNTNSISDIYNLYINTTQSLDEILNTIPDEFHTEFVDQWNILVTREKEIITEVTQVFEQTKKNPNNNRKEFALAIKDRPDSGILFAMYQGKDTTQLIKRLLKPPEVTV